MVVLYVVIVLIASILGAISGIGGGVIIKPILDAISPYNTFVIGVLSCFAVLTMAVSSVTKQAINKTPIDLSVAVPLGLGSIVGGVIGDVIFTYVRAGSNDNVVKIAQACVLIALLLFVVIYMLLVNGKENKVLVKSKILTIIVGLVLGMLSTFIGIGGGPINIAVLCLLFGMDIKGATINSLVMIIFSQLAKLVKLAISGTLFVSTLPWWMILAMSVFAVIGGLIGSTINKKIENKHILTVYISTMIFIIAINVYNVVVNVIALNV